MRALLGVVVLVGCTPGPAQSGFKVDPDSGVDDPADCELAIVEFVGKMVTISGIPLGLGDTDRETPVTGRFGWKPCIADGDSFEGYGTFPHGGDALFELDWADGSVRGSGFASVETVVWDDSQTFRYVDGARVAAVDGSPPQMTLNDVPAADLSLWMSLTVVDQLDADVAPASLTIDPALPHTFSLEDSGGTLLLQLTEG